MELKIISREIALISLFVWSMSFLVLFYILPNSEKIMALSSHGSMFFVQKEKQTGEGLPARLIIPSINVNTTVEHVGITPEGAMDVPKDIKNVAWYNLGSIPGEGGSAVISGHYGWKSKKVSAFDTLYKLRTGEKVYVEDSNGNTTTFIVREVRKYDPTKDASYVFSSNTSRAHLNLITCGGTWNQATKSYSNRLVIFTDKEIE